MRIRVGISSGHAVDRHATFEAFVTFSFVLGQSCGGWRMYTIAADSRMTFSGIMVVLLLRFWYLERTCMEVGVALSRCLLPGVCCFIRCGGYLI